ISTSGASPGKPSNNPQAGVYDLSNQRDRLEGFVTSYSLIIPCPPCVLPAHPEVVLKPYLFILSGYFDSSTSIGKFLKSPFELLTNPDWPSSAEKVPHPPAVGSTYKKVESSSFRPDKVITIESP